MFGVQTFSALRFCVLWDQIYDRVASLITLAKLEWQTLPFAKVIKLFNVEYYFKLTHNAMLFVCQCHISTVCL